MPEETVYLTEIELKIMRMFVEAGVMDDRLVIQSLEQLKGKLEK